jgi:fatty-acyl-CoA synthase
MYALNLSESWCPAQTDEALHDTTVGDVLRAAAARTPEAIALVEADGDGELRRRWTYAQLLADSERLAHALLTRYRPGERIAVWAPNIPEWVIAEFGLALAGITLVTVNPGYQPRELRYVLEQSRSAGLFLIGAHRGNPMAEIAGQVVAELPAIREVVDMEDHAALFREAGPRVALPDVDPRDAAQIQYTSGTTGFPKGVVLHHHGITNNARHGFARMDMPYGATTLVVMPLFHTGGCGMAILGGVQFGCRMILMRQFEPQRANTLIESEGVIGMMGVPTMLIGMLEADAAIPRDFSSVEMAGSGGVDGAARTDPPGDRTARLRLLHRIRPDRDLPLADPEPGERSLRRSLQHGGPAHAAHRNLDPRSGDGRGPAARYGRRDLRARL